jgi:molybdopterin synthase catalytic subunit
VHIEVLYFGAARERAGRARGALELPDGATVRAARVALAESAALAALLPHVRIAVNERFAADDQALADGDVVALIPPVAGGAPLVALTAEPLDARAVEALVAGPDRGGLVTFTGAVRDHTGPHAVTRLEYEAYEPMALRVLEAIRGEAAERWPGVRVAVHHRLGVLAVGEAAVVVATAAPHRADAFAACQHVIDRLKQDVPIFKKEVRADGSVWVGLGP